MGYEISGAWGAKMAMPDREVVVLVGDGSYLMMNSDLYSTVLTGHKLIVVVCDNGGYAVIDRLQVNQGGASFNNLFADCRTERLVAVDFAAHAAAMGCETETVRTIGELESAIERARAADRTYVIALKTHPHRWTEGGSFWEVGVPEVSTSVSVRDAREAMDAAAPLSGWAGEQGGRDRRARLGGRVGRDAGRGPGVRRGRARRASQGSVTVSESSASRSFSGRDRADNRRLAGTRLRSG